MIKFKKQTLLNMCIRASMIRRDESLPGVPELSSCRIISKHLPIDDYADEVLRHVLLKSRDALNRELGDTASASANASAAVNKLTAMKNKIKSDKLKDRFSKGKLECIDECLAMLNKG